MTFDKVSDKDCMKAISMDLRKRIVEAYDSGEGTRQEIADRFKVSIHLVKKLLLQKKEEQFRFLVETTSDFIWEVDEKGTYLCQSPGKIHVGI